MPNLKKLISDNEYSFLKTKDPNQIKQIMDFRFYNQSYNIFGSKLLYSEAEDNYDAFVYKSYGTHFVGGDWGLQDEISLIRTIWEIDKSTGEMV